MTYFEAKDPDTGKAPKHQRTALSGNSISNTEVKPSEDEKIESLHGFTVEEMKEIQETADAELLDNEPFDEMRGKIYQFSDGSEWIIFESSEAAEKQAVEYVQNMIEEEPETFDQDWIKDFIYMSDTDRRIIADEEATDYAYDQLDEEEVMEETGFDEKSDELQESIDVLESKAEDLEIEKANLESAVEDEGDETGEIADEISDLEDEISKKMDEIHLLGKQQEALPDEAREKVQEDKYDEIYDELEDPVQYFVEDHGMYNMEDLINATFISIDEHEAAKGAIDTDGVAHFLAGYDGEEVEVGDTSMVMFRTN